MIYKSNLASAQALVSCFAKDERVACSDETSLVLYGIMDCAVVAHFDVSSTLFAAAKQATGRPVTNLQGRRSLTLSDDVIIHEGTRPSIIRHEGIYTYPLEDIQTRFKLKGDRRDLSAPPARSVPPKSAPKGPTWGELSAEEQDYEARCKRADWYYSFSDDRMVWRNGRDCCEALRKEATAKGGVYVDIYKYYSTR
mgnify:CR=1 FL=1